MALAYSYLRFSSVQQAAGDSIRRQLEKTQAWCERNGVKLDNSLTLRDEGVSAFRGKHRESSDVDGLGRFLSAVKTGRVPKGSFLVVENLDRLSREEAVPALTLLLNLIGAGIKVVQLIPVEVVYHEKSEGMALMQAIMELSRGHSESKVKSERSAAVWADKRKNAANEVLTRCLPGWIRYEDGKLVLNPAAAATVRRVFMLARDGNGAKMIAKKLNAEGVPILGRTTFKGRPVVWSEQIVYHLLTTRTTLGELQPCKAHGFKRVPCGDPLPGYYPAVIEPELFYAVQAQIKARSSNPHARGRRGSHVNLFAGLLADARDGGSLTYNHHRALAPTLVPVGPKRGPHTAWSSFPAWIFEEAVLSLLAEVQAKDIWQNGDAVHKVEALAGRLAETDNLLKLWQAKMEDPRTVDLVADKLAELSARRKQLAGDLAEAQRQAAKPVSESWGEFRSLAELVAKDSEDDLRMRTRSALRRSIECVMCLFLRRGGLRLAAVQVHFRDSKTRRDYLIVYRQGRVTPRWHRESEWWARSFADVPNVGAFDLRKPDHVRRLEAKLSDIELTAPGG